MIKSVKFVNSPILSGISESLFSLKLRYVRLCKCGKESDGNEEISLEPKLSI